MREMYVTYEIVSLSFVPTFDEVVYTRDRIAR